MEIKIQKSDVWKLIIAIGICELTGIVSSLFSNPHMNPWFDGLEKPSWNPPSNVFGPVWTVLYLLMGVSLWLVWKSNTAINKKEIAISFFIIQLFLNFWWSLLFFRFHSPGSAFADIVLLLVFIIITMIHFFPISKFSAYILIPYALWVSFASALNYSIWILNK
jgi:benzodiazapine receptor